MFYGILKMFAAFILCCGSTHLLGVRTLGVPIYRLEGVVKALTTVILLVTAVFLVDNGLGIPDQLKVKVFTVFKRLQSKSKYPGTGIGLATCKKNC